MQKKPKTMQDKAVVPDENKDGASLIEPSPQPSPLQGDVVTIVMKSGRGWQLAKRVLKPGERVTLDEATARSIVEAGYADFVE